MNYLFAGLGIGMLLPQIVSNENHEIIYSSLILPHVNFKKVKEYLAKNNLQISYEHYINYIKDVGSRMFFFTSYYLYKRREYIKFEKQQKTFDMIEDFEFVRESCENIDFILDESKILFKKQIEEQKNIETKFIEEQKKKIYSEDDENLNNIELIKNLAKDDYEKYLLKDSVVTSIDYYKELSPDFKVSQEKNRLAILQVYNNMVEDSERRKRGDDLLEKANRIRNKSIEKMEDKIAQEDKEILEKIRNYNKPDVKEKPDITKKFPNTISEVEKIKELKEVFGDK
jgi:hypothetical protein